LDSLNLRQKAGRVLLLALALVITSILFAMAGAVGLFIMEKGREIGSRPEFYNGVLIILTGIAVNLGCVFILFQIKKTDIRLVPPKK
jgi:hypothetical protein